MPLFGSHLSVAGGMVNALIEGERLKMDTVQVFTKNQQQWKARPLDPKASQDWLTELKRLGWTDRAVSHASYLINLASPDDGLWNKSIDLMVVELERCEALSIPFLVHHPGAYTTSDEDAGLTRIAKAYKQIFKRTKGFRTVSCLEDTVGSGSNLGRTFDQLADLRGRIIDQTGEPARVGFCLDTCHAHAGGYDMSSRASADAALDEFDRLCGLDNLRCLHLNDSLKAMGSRRDRHAHIGEGTITNPPERKRRALRDSGFAAVVNRPELRGKPMILETPKGDDEKGVPHDSRNLRRLRQMVD
ncbi:MAG: deoxyribonuclease IV [Phycisphaeraceae bacterium]|nr:MAG: deoxyribonuclease IV [Phycisphaeraceae bacterium]